jgi:hypothetical protein
LVTGAVALGTTFTTCLTTGAAFGGATFTGAGAVTLGAGAGASAGAVEGTRTVGVWTVTVVCGTVTEVLGTVSAATLAAPSAKTAKVARKECAAIRLRLPVLMGALCTSDLYGLNVQSAPSEADPGPPADYRDGL